MQHNTVLAKGCWCSVVGKVTAGLVESNASLSLGLWLKAPVGWPPRDQDPAPMLISRYINIINIYPFTIYSNVTLSCSNAAYVFCIHGNWFMSICKVYKCNIISSNTYTRLWCRANQGGYILCRRFHIRCWGWVIVTAKRPVASAIEEVLADIRAWFRTLFALSDLGLRVMHISTVGAITLSDQEVTADLSHRHRQTKELKIPLSSCTRLNYFTHNTVTGTSDSRDLDYDKRALTLPFYF